jgi:hypothetical protein
VSKESITHQQVEALQGIRLGLTTIRCMVLGGKRSDLGTLRDVLRMGVAVDCDHGVHALAHLAGIAEAVQREPH